MMKGKYIYDKERSVFRRATLSLWSVLGKGIKFMLVTLSLSLLYYIVFALLFSTDTERRLKQENKAFAREYDELERKERLLSEVVGGLRARDNAIYEDIFRSPAPDVEMMSSLDYLAGLDSIPDRDIVKRSAARLSVLERGASGVEANFMAVMKAVTDSGFVMPPMTKPLEDFSFAQTGASTGDRINPFYKVPIRHDGLDLIAPAGEPVLAVADGVVSQVIRSRKGLGNVVVIDHGNGYVTRYGHLADVEARKGRKVSKGTRIGYVGVSGNSFAPHLHYEVIRDTVVLDPVNHFFASVTPDEYVNMLILSATTGQSMD